jgi:hypothetical protein
MSGMRGGEGEALLYYYLLNAAPCAGRYFLKDEDLWDSCFRRWPQDMRTREQNMRPSAQHLRQLCLPSPVHLEDMLRPTVNRYVLVTIFSCLATCSDCWHQSSYLKKRRVYSSWSLHLGHHHCVTPWSWVLLQKPEVANLLKNLRFSWRCIWRTRSSGVYEEALISLWLYKENNKLRDWKKCISSTYSPLISTHL